MRWLSPKAIISSIRTTTYTGTVAFAQAPVLSPVALDVLRQQSIGRKGAEVAFKECFDGYYVADLRVGASNATMVSADAASSSSSKDVALEITVEFLLFSDTESWGSHESSSTDTGAKAYALLKPLAGEKVKRGKSVEARVQESMRELNLFDG